jgi:polysaccharide export outer membrane protein
MRLRFIFQSASALTIAALALAIHAQSPTGSSIAQMGSGGNASSAGNVAAAAKSAVGGGLIAVPEDFSKLKIAPGFLLDIEVFDEPDLSGQLRVADDGNIVLPFAGPVHVVGNTLAEAQQKIQTSLQSAEILKNPQVTLNISQYASTVVTVLGEVNSSGRLQMLAPHSLLDLISFAGGETAMAGNVIQLRHEESGQVKTTSYHYGRSSNGDTISNVMVHNGDTVIVPRAGIVYVLGAVNRPGGFLMQEDGKLDVAQAISLAWGLDLAAKTNIIRVIRRKPDGTFVEFTLSYKDMIGGKITPPQLQEQDIVYVPMSTLKSALLHGTTLIGELSTASIYTAR